MDTPCAYPVLLSDIIFAESSIRSLYFVISLAICTRTQPVGTALAVLSQKRQIAYFGDGGAGWVT